jgi:hypothetical protein
MDYYFFYLKQGLSHITDLSAYDHILFIVSFACIYNFKDIKKIMLLVTGFTAGHSIALCLSTLEIIKINIEISEFLIPITIIISSLINLKKIIQSSNLKKKQNTKNTLFHVEHKLKTDFTLITLFGLIHGLGFSNYLRFILSSEENIFIPLLSFNIGLEIGQIIIVVVVLLINLVLLRRSKKIIKYWNITILIVIVLVSIKLVLSNSGEVINSLNLN